jgi:hypothetical protein
LGKVKGTPYKDTAASFQHLTDEIDDLIDYWKGKLGIGTWTLYISYVPHYCSTSKDINANIGCQWEYRNAHINFFLPALLKLDSDDLEQTVVHELCHCVVDPLVNKHSKQKSVEVVVTDMAKALLATKRAERK